MAASVFQDDNGNKSSMRVIWSICTLGILVVWGIISIKTNTFVPFSMGDAVLLIGLFGGKVAQKYVETNKPASK